MKLIETVSNNIKKTLRNWLIDTPLNSYVIQIQELFDYETNAIRNKIWYRGDSNELQQLYQTTREYADKYKFWACNSTSGLEIRKLHTGLPNLIIKTLSSVVLTDLNDFEFKNKQHEDIWKEIDKENKFKKLIEKALKDVLCVGDGAFKLTFDTNISQYPILEWYSGEKIDYVYERGRLKEIVFKTEYIHKKQRYVLLEYYGHGYIRNELYRGETEVPINSIPNTEKVQDCTFDTSLMLATPIKVFESSKHENRGASIFDGKLDNFDALDEIWSQWLDAVRSGRAKEYIPESLCPRNPNTGQVIAPNPFDNRYIAIGDELDEHGVNKITLEQPTIPHDSYIASFTNALDLCLQGLISPSTLGIDIKKLDNAEAQREKEKTTLYTRNAIIDELQETLPLLVETCINAYNTLLTKSIEEIEVSVTFGEYANPSFESQVETIGKAKTQGIMSIEATVEELYGDTKEQEWKEQEVARLKAEQGITVMEEPGINTEGVDIIESQNRQPNIPNEPKGI